MKTENKLKVILVKPRCNPEVIEVENELEALQSLVGGYIETVTMPIKPYHIIVCNEEGKLQRLPLNRQVGGDIIVGTFFITKSQGSEFVSLEQEEIDELLELYSLTSTKFRAVL